MAARIAGLDWSSTALGPADTWPEPLRAAVQLMLNSRFPMFVWWGPELINLYNDAYVPMLGSRHPKALGAPAEEQSALAMVPRSSGRCAGSIDDDGCRMKPGRRSRSSGG